MSICTMKTNMKRQSIMKHKILTTVLMTLILLITCACGKQAENGTESEEIKAFRQKYVNMCDGHATERTISLIEK